MKRSVLLGAAHAAGLTLVVVVVVVVIATTRADVDLWGHVRFGEDILDSGRIDRVDPYSFTSDREWLNHEWLAEVIFALAWRAGATPALIAIKLACTFGALAILGAMLRRKGVTMQAAVPLLGLALVGILQRTTHVRPQLFSVVLFAALLYVLDRGSRRHVWLTAAAPIMTVWANAHGGWIVGLATTGIWIAGLMWERRNQGWRVLVLAAYALLAVGATLLNPYGVGLWTFLLETVRFGREAIAEWGPLWSNPPLLMIWGLIAAAAISAVARVPTNNPAVLIVPAIWGLAALRVSRLDAFFAISAVALLAPHSRLLPLLTSRHQPRRLSTGPAVFVAGLACAAATAVPTVRAPFNCIEVYTPWWPEPAAVDFLRQERPGQRVVTFFRWGEYAIWHLSDVLKVSMDGRRETVYSDKVVDGHLRFYEGTPEGLAFAERLDPDVVWLPRGFLAIPLLERSGWRRIFDGPQSVMLAPQDYGGSGRLRADPSIPASRCFPGP